MNVIPGIVSGELVALAHKWLPSQRWFAGKQRAISEVNLVEAVTLAEGNTDQPRLEQLVISVSYTDGGSPELYQLLIGLRPNLPQRLEYAQIGVVETADGLAFAYDAVHDPAATSVLLKLLANNAKVGNLVFAQETGAQIKSDLQSRPVQAEQSNTSIVFGEDYILKLFRKLHYGISPDVELHRVLREAGSTHIAQPYAAFEGTLPHGGIDEQVTFGLLQEFFRNSSEGWGMAVASVRDLISETEERAERAGGDFAAESYRLGQAVSAVHSELAKALGTTVVASAQLAREMLARFEIVANQVTEVAIHGAAIQAVFNRLSILEESVQVQRIHGDLHLGQVMRTLQGWVLIDFEGEPSRSLTERRRMASPLQDVAGMLRSFDYAAHHLLLNWEGDDELQARGAQWVRRNRQAFIDGYSSTDYPQVLSPQQHPILLKALELDKALYEITYELNHRPSWVPIPLGSIAQLTA